MIDQLLKDTVLRIGEVCGIDGRKVFVALDKNKNSSDLLFDGKVIKNVAVGSFVEIKKGFISIIGKVDGEQLEEDSYLKKDENNDYIRVDRNKRLLTVSLSGYIGFDGKFVGGIRELPLIGNEAFILTEEKVHLIHALLKGPSTLSVTVAKTDIEGIPIKFPVDGLFNSHIAIFGNTGSGKSNTLASLYQEFLKVVEGNEALKAKCRFLLFDFNGEFAEKDCLSLDKCVYNLSTRGVKEADRIPISFDQLLELDTIAILVEASDKTQKPFLRRTIRFYENVKAAEKKSGRAEFSRYVANILRKKIRETLRSPNKEISSRLLDYIQEIFEILIEPDQRFTADQKREITDDLRNDIEFFNGTTSWFLKEAGKKDRFFNSDESAFVSTNFFKSLDKLSETEFKGLSHLDEFRIFLHLQLADDLFRYKVQNDHVYPVINRFKAKQLSIERTFQVGDSPDLWKGKCLTVINLHDVNLDMKKTIPLLLAKNAYIAHKSADDGGSLGIIVDEAHNILSTTSFRETEEWKDYRLETFEEIIKEGRKFGVFVTISSQRPNDISETIISQAHNYFIHQLINQKDLLTIGNAVSYIDRITEESIPTLAVGTCIFSGIATPMPLKIRFDELPEHKKPDSHTLRFEKLLAPDA